MADTPEPQQLEYLDLTHAIEQVGDMSTVQGMLTLFEESLARDIPRIGQLLVASDQVGSNRLLHGLKGVALIFCEKNFASEIGRVEAVSRTGSLAEAAQAYFGLMPDLEQLQLEIAGYLNDH